MSTDAATPDTSPVSVISELEQAQALLARLKTQGLDPAKALALLAPEAEKTAVDEPVVVKKPRKAKAVRAKTAAKAVKTKTATKEPKKLARAQAAATPKAAKPVRKPISGQSGPPIEDLPWSALNKKEKLLIGAFDLEGEREVRTIEQLAEVFTNAKNKAQAYSWARNSLRRPMRNGGWLEKLKAGEYRLTAAARKRLAAKD